MAFPHPPRWVVLRATWLVVAALTAPVAAASDRAPVYVEDSPAAQESIDQALSLRRQQRLIEAAEQLQQVITAYPHKLIAVGDGQYQDVAAWVCQRLLEDPPLLAAYRQAHGPIAQRQLNEATEPTPNLAALEDVLAQYALTPAGLEAALTLAGLYLEQADFTSAAGVLASVENHPDLQTQRGRYLLLQGAWALLTGRAERFRSYRDELAASGFAGQLSLLDQWRSGLQPPRTASQAPSSDASAQEGPPAWEEEPLWEASIAWDPLETQARYVPPTRLTRRGDDDAVPLPILPVLDDQRLYLNEGNRIRALDRHSGWTLWTFEGEADAKAADVPQVAIPLVARLEAPPPEPRRVLLVRDRLFAVLGPAGSWSNRFQHELAPSVLVCLSRHDGRQRWALSPSQLDATLASARFQGTPLSDGHRLFVLMQRNQVTGLQDTFLLALDQASGQPLWRRHLSSAVTSNRYASGPPPQMTLQDGVIYAYDRVGVVAAVEARTGAMRWACMLPMEAGVLEHLYSGIPPETQGMRAGLLLSRAGLLVPAPAGSSTAFYLLEAATGRKLRDLRGQEWQSASLWPAADDVLAVGRSIALLDGTTLEPKWRVGWSTISSAQPVGTPAIAADQVLIPTRDRVIAISLADGSVLHRASVDGPGNLALGSGQLVMATTQTLRGYLSWDSAYAQLHAQMKRHPTEPAPGLALAHLALRSHRLPIVLEGVDAALAALRRRPPRASPDEPDPVQQQVFDHLLRLADPAQEAVDPGLRSGLLDRLATITAGPDQEVAYHLAMAQHSQQADDPTQAVEHLQAVLMDRTLWAQPYSHQQTTRLAGLEAQLRLEELVEGHGRQIYAHFDALAAQRLAELTTSGASAQAFLDLARQYPLAQAAPQALYQAGHRLMRSADPLSAAAPLRRAYQQASDPQLQAQAAGLLAQLYAQAGQAHRALNWLDQVSQQHPALEPWRDGRPTPIDVWTARLSQMNGGRGALPRLSL
ncbi:MAG TPA: PQQ-binding-like beta-propeller repeat protein, partial [Phycisphaeraceae bacterium]